MKLRITAAQFRNLLPAPLGRLAKGRGEFAESLLRSKILSLRADGMNIYIEKRDLSARYQRGNKLRALKTDPDFSGTINGQRLEIEVKETRLKNTEPRLYFNSSGIKRHQADGLRKWMRLDAQAYIYWVIREENNQYTDYLIPWPFIDGIYYGEQKCITAAWAKENSVRLDELQETVRDWEII